MLYVVSVLIDLIIFNMNSRYEAGSIQTIRIIYSKYLRRPSAGLKAKYSAKNSQASCISCLSYPAK